jgi:hypothetical protein
MEKGSNRGREKGSVGVLENHPVNLPINQFNHFPQSKTHRVVDNRSDEESGWRLRTGHRRFFGAQSAALNLTGMLQAPQNDTY